MRLFCYFNIVYDIKQQKEATNIKGARQTRIPCIHRIQFYFMSKILKIKIYTCNMIIRKWPGRR